MPHTKSIENLFEELQTSELGLSGSEAEKRLQKYGQNKLPEAKVDKVYQIFIRQFKSSLIYILLVASAIVFLMGDITDGIIILAVLFFNAVVGTIQEGKAQNTLAALKKFVETKATVLRDGIGIIIPDYNLVPGDIIFLQEGEKIPADARIIISNSLKIDQASLTGESEPVFKIAEKIEKENIPVADRKNMVFRGTHIVAGNARAIITATGINTEIGKISQKIATIDREIPLQRDIKELSHFIIVAVFLISIFLFASGFLFFEKSVKEMFSTVVALAVSIIPEGLPVVVTLILASGVWRMTKQNALVKRLQAVEALGQAKIIAVDKTGTITKNELVITKIFDGEKMFDVSGVGYESIGEIFLSEDKKRGAIVPQDFPGLMLAGKIAAFCSNVYVTEYLDEKSRQKLFKISGDPTEASNLIFSQKLGFKKELVDKQHKMIFELPFDYLTKYHAVIRESDGDNFLTVVGAPEKVLDLCDIPKKEKDELESVFYKMSRDGLRVLAFAYKNKAPKVIEADEMPKLVFGGFYGIKDALKPEVKESVRKAIDAGLRIIMITGDHKLTAEAIAGEAGIFKEGDEILIGEDIESLSIDEIAKKLENVSVFARVSPEHKLRIIEAYKKRKEIIAMTGDGVNDAPALVAADLGVAMGKIGTEVAKEASDIVLLDDNFGNIISAIEEGRNIYKTIKKVILYLFSTSAGEVLTIIGALFLSYPLPLLPGQIIWLNFVTDGFLDVALAMEPKEKGLLLKWKKGSHRLIDSLMVSRIFIMAIPMAIGALIIFHYYLSEYSFEKALTMSLTTLAIFQWFNAWNCRSEEKSVFTANLFSNKWLIGALFTVVSLQLLVVYNPVLQNIFHTVPLELSDWLIAVGAAFSIVAVEELRKFVYSKIKLWTTK